MTPQKRLNIIFGTVFFALLAFAIIQSHKTIEGPLDMVFAVEGGTQKGPELTVLNFNYIMTDKYAYQLIFTDKTKVLNLEKNTTEKAIRIPVPKTIGPVSLYLKNTYRAKGWVKKTKGSFKGLPVQNITLRELELISEKIPQQHSKSTQ